MLKNRGAILNEARQVFSKAMLAGYVGGSKDVLKSISNDGNTKLLTFIQGDFKVEDEYHTTKSTNYSAGTTTIFYQNNPIWVMFYCGEYSKEIIPYLKKALAFNYESSKLETLRGPSVMLLGLYECMVLTYRCKDMSERASNFASFRGYEEIVGQYKDGKEENLMGYHRFMGMSLI